MNAKQIIKQIPAEHCIQNAGEIYMTELGMIHFTTAMTKEFPELAETMQEMRNRFSNLFQVEFPAFSIGNRHFNKVFDRADLEPPLAPEITETPQQLTDLFLRVPAEERAQWSDGIFVTELGIIHWESIAVEQWPIFRFFFKRLRNQFSRYAQTNEPAFSIGERRFYSLADLDLQEAANFAA